MNSAPSNSTAAGDWLVVIARAEASVYRSVATNAAPQLIRVSRPERGTGRRPETGTYLNGRDHSGPPGFFEPLAGVLHGARRILIFGQAATLVGDCASPFIAWLRRSHPDIAARVVASVPVEPQPGGDAGLLDRARAFYQRGTARVAATFDSTRAAGRPALP